MHGPSEHRPVRLYVRFGTNPAQGELSEAEVGQSTRKGCSQALATKAHAIANRRPSDRAAVIAFLRLFDDCAATDYADLRLLKGSA